jgi:hypothetical protein
VREGCARLDAGFSYGIKVGDELGQEAVELHSTLLYGDPRCGGEEGLGDRADHEL